MPESLRVLQVYRDHFGLMPGGIERHVHDLATGLAGRIGMEVLASARRARATTFIEEDVRLHLVRELARLGGIPIWWGAGPIMRRGFDVLHLHVPNPTGELRFLALRQKPPSVVTYHADVFRAPLLSRGYALVLRKVLDRADRIVVSTRSFAERSPLISPIMERDPERIEVIPFGVDLQRFHPGATAGSLALRAGWGSGPFALFVGRLRHYKGLADLVRAVAGTGMTLVVAGDGPERERLIAEGRAALGDRFVWLGAVDDRTLPDVYRAADVFCLPSTSGAETFGIATVEALASGIPAVTTEVSTGTSTVNAHGITGVVVPPKDPESLREALTSLVGDDSSRRRMAVEARRRAEAMFGRTQMLDRMFELYLRVLSNAAP